MKRSLFAALLLIALAPLAACGDDTTTEASGAPDAPGSAGGADPGSGTTADPGSEPGTATGTVTVRLEEVGGVFIEGFEVALRFEDGDGDTIASTHWTDFVTGQDGEAATDYYGSVLEQPVPAGTVTVRAETAVGIGPPPVKPDLDGDLRCSLELEVPAGGQVAVEVGFGDDGNCLRRL
ncbi:MAG: hypothetical protein R2749_00330 [Acidimicrobiales bacterium]